MRSQPLIWGVGQKVTFGLRSEPHDSRHRNKVMQDREHTFTLAMLPGEAGLPKSYGQWAGLERATDVAEVLQLFSGRLPRPVNCTFIVDDNPAIMLPYSQRDRMVELASQGECALPYRVLVCC